MNLSGQGVPITSLTMKEERRLEVIQGAFRGDLMVGEAAMILAVSEQCYRLKARVTKEGQGLRLEWGNE